MHRDVELASFRDSRTSPNDKPATRYTPFPGGQRFKVTSSAVQKSSVSATVFNITKTCVGSTVLAAPDALQYAGGLRTFLSMMVLNIMLHTCTYALMTFGCARCGARTFREWWLAVYGNRGILLFDILLFVSGLTSLIAYVILIGEFVTKSFEGLFPSLTLLHSRSLITWLVTLGALLPLSMLKDLSSLAAASKLGLVCATYGGLFMVADYMYADVDPVSVALSPAAFPSANVEHMSAAGILIGAAGTQVLLPKLYSELAEGSPWKFTMASLVAEVSAHCFYFVFGVVGYARFGPAPTREEGNVLANYSSGTCWELLAWLSLAFNTVGMYPLQFSPVRDSAIGVARMLWPVAREEKETSQPDEFELHAWTLGLVGFSVLCALQGVGLATINLIKGIFIMPLLCFVIPMALFRGSGLDFQQLGRNADWMYAASWVISGVGLLVMADGPYRLVQHFARHAPEPEPLGPLVSLNSTGLRVGHVPHAPFGSMADAEIWQ